MSKLELKAPPLLLVVLFALLMWLVSRWLPDIDVQFPVRFGACLLLSIVGILVVLAGVIEFRKARTTVNPVRPETSTTLVTSGIYRVTRNPMYLGFLLILIGWGLLLANLFSLLLVLVFVAYMNRFQIEPEEKILASLFGAEFAAYKQRVRRWL